jgi:hypothetical protein
MSDMQYDILLNAEQQNQWVTPNPPYDHEAVFYWVKNKSTEKISVVQACMGGERLKRKQGH